MVGIQIGMGYAYTTHGVDWLLCPHLVLPGRRYSPMFNKILTKKGRPVLVGTISMEKSERLILHFLKPVEEDMDFRSS
jgi:hypothetical protein